MTPIPAELLGLGCIKVFPVISRFSFVVLTLVDHVAQFHAFQGSPGSLETLETQHGLHSPFDTPVILLYKVVQVFEDKIVKRAVVMLLEPIYEQDFYNCSFGFRKQRSAHDALQSLRGNIMREDCSRVEVVLPKRFERFGLKLHPEKTRRVDFRAYRRKENKRKGTPVSFDG